MNVILPGDGTAVATVTVDGAEQQVVQVSSLPAVTLDAAALAALANAATPAIQPVSVLALPLPAGAATESTAAALLGASQAIQAASETLAARTINTSAIAGTVALDAPSLAALETVSIANFPGIQPVSGPLTDAQLRGAAVPVSGTFFQGTQPVSIAGAVSVSGMRRDADTAYASDLGAHPLMFNDGGRLKVSVTPADIMQTTGSITANAQTVAMQIKRLSNLSISMVATALVGHNVTFEASNNTTNGADGNWYGVQVVRSNANTVEAASGVLAATPGYMWQVNVSDYAWFRVRATAHTSGTAAYSLNPSAYVSEPIPAVQVTATQPIWGTVTANQGAWVLPTAINLNSSATTNASIVKASSGTLYNLSASNNGAAAAFLKLYNQTTAPTVGSSVPVLVIALPAGATTTHNLGAIGHRFTAGISMAITGAMPDADTTAIAAGQVKVLASFI